MEIVFVDDPEPGSPDTTEDNKEGDPNKDNDSHDLFHLPDPDRYGCGKQHKKPNRHLFDECLWTTYSRFQRDSSHPKPKV